MEKTFYKPTKRETGGAFKFNLHTSGRFSFMKAAPQIGPMADRFTKEKQKVFGWDDETAINVKMTDEDCGSLLSVIYKLNPNVSLYHQTDNDNKIIEFTFVPDRKGFSLKVSQKVQGNAEPRQVFIGMTYAEAMVFKCYLEAVVRENLWSNSQREQNANR